jgi:hypothetical protein
MQYRLRPIGTSWTDPVTSDDQRRQSLFKATWQDTLNRLFDEVDWLGGAGPVVIQADLEEKDLRLDGGLRANAKVGDFPGVIVSFDSRFGPLRYATDMHVAGWNWKRMKSWQHNVRAVALALESLRAVDRYGVSKRGQQYTGWRAIAAPAPTFASADEAFRWMRKYAADELNLVIEGDLTPKKLYRAMAMKMHPDQGHPRADWDRLDEARRMLTEAGRM